MPSPNDLIRRTQPPKRWAHFLKDLTGPNDPGRALGSEGRIDLSSVPTQLPDGRYVHIEGLMGVIVADVDTDGSNAVVPAERVLGAFTNFQWGALSGKLQLFEGGAIDGRVARFLEVAVRNGRAYPALPGDAAANAVAADVFTDPFRLIIRFPNGGKRPGLNRPDGCIFRGFFQDLLGQDAFRYTIPAGGFTQAGVTLNSFTRVTWYALCYADPFPIVDSVPRVEYHSTVLTDDTVQPIDTAARAHAVEYAGFRQLEEDTEALDFSAAGNLTIRHGAYSPQVARSMEQIQDQHAGSPGLLPAVDSDGTGIAARYAPVTGHLPLVWDGALSDRDGWGRAPYQYTLTSKGASRTTLRLLRSEITSWSSEQVAAAAEELGIPADRLADLQENVRAVQIDPSLLPRRIVIG